MEFPITNVVSNLLCVNLDAVIVLICSTSHSNFYRLHNCIFTHPLIPESNYREGEVSIHTKADWVVICRTVLTVSLRASNLSNYLKKTILCVINDLHLCSFLEKRTTNHFKWSSLMDRERLDLNMCQRMSSVLAFSVSQSVIVM